VQDHSSRNQFVETFLDVLLENLCCASAVASLSGRLMEEMTSAGVATSPMGRALRRPSALESSQL